MAFYDPLPRPAQLRSGLFSGGHASTEPDLLAATACKTYSGCTGYLPASLWWDRICTRIPYLGAGVWEDGPRGAAGYPRLTGGLGYQ
jgi:hypothetical protein